MLNRVQSLRDLAKAVFDSPSREQRLVQVVDVVRDSLAVDRAFLVYVQDRDFLTCGDSSSSDGLATTQMGLWLVQHQIEISGGPVAFNICHERVEEITGALDADGQAFVGFPVPSGGTSAEMLIVRGPWESRIDDGVFAFVETATPALALILEQELSTSRAARHREQMTALASAAELLTQAERMEAVLEELATAIAYSSGYELASIDVYDERTQLFAISAVNQTPQVNTSLGQLWRTQAVGLKYPREVMDLAMRSRKPLLVSDLQTNERIPAYARKFFGNAHIFAGGQFPLIFRDEFLGTLRVASQRPRSFSPQEVDILEGFAAQLAVALKAVCMYKALAESEEQLREYSQQLQEGMEIQHRLARTDALTGIPNRRYADEVVKGEHARVTRHKTPLSVAIADVDFFKAINDTYGHKAGDEALVQLADLARRSCRQGDVVGRYGGDEFLFVLSEADRNAAKRFADRFRSSVAKQVFHLSSGQRIRMTVSLGVAELDREGGQRPSALVSRADEALYEAKSQGRNRTIAYRSPRQAA
jgi:diguanylate cyclase (GGDEF)-like protein